MEAFFGPSNTLEEIRESVQLDVSGHVDNIQIDRWTYMVVSEIKGEMRVRRIISVDRRLKDD